MNNEEIKAFLQDIIECNFTQPLVDNITSDVAKDILDYITNLQEKEDYKSRNEKAIEYLKSNEWVKDYKISNCRTHLLNILGGDKE